MSEWQTELRKFRRRVRIARAWRGVAVGGACGAIACAVWAGLDLLRVLYTEWLWMGAVVAACSIAGLAVGALRPVRERALGDSIDRRAGLKNRLGTAIAGAEASDEFLEAQRSDAVRHVAKLKPAAVFPLRWCRWHWALSLFAGLAALLFVLGNTPLLMSAEKRQERKELQEAAASVERVAKPIADDPTENTPEAKDLAREMQRYARELQKGRLNKEEALQKADDLTKKADELSRSKYAEADRLMDEAQTAFDRAMKQKLDEQGLTGASESDLKASDEEMDAKRQALNSKISDLQNKLNNSANSSQAQRSALQAQLKRAQNELQQLQLSENARKTLQKLFSMKEFQDLMKLAQKMKKATAAGKRGQDKLTKEQIKEMQKQLEDLAKQLKDDKAMRDYIQKLREAMKKSQGG